MILNPRKLHDDMFAHAQRLVMSSLILSKAFKLAPPDKPFKLASGKLSTTFVDVKLAAHDPMYLKMICDALGLLEVELRAFATLPRINAYAGVALGGCALAAGMAISDGETKMLYVRKEPKDHGTGKLVEGPFEPGDRVIVIEDVVTTGQSSLRAVQNLQEAGLKVEAVLAVVDREDGGAETFREARIPFAAICTLDELKVAADKYCDATP
jgi:orotate phosphoribosyltransferase